ncbi:MAG: J domain-containing protein [Hyphomicrobiaceae bacterium]
MFERNKVEAADHNGVPVEITTVDGEVFAGRVMIPLGRTFSDCLNGPATFIEFEPWGEQRIFVAKSTLRNVKLINVPRAENLGARARALDAFDPHAILGVPAGATLAEAKAQWHKLSKVYHPDKFATMDLPAEVTAYISAMAQRVNAAYSAIEHRFCSAGRLLRCVRRPSTSPVSGCDLRV